MLAVWLTTAHLSVTVWWRPGLGKGPLGGSCNPTWVLKKTQSGAKPLFQSKNIPVGCRLRRCQHTKVYAGWLFALTAAIWRTFNCRHGPKLHWRDVIVKDIQRMGLDALNWYVVAQNQPKWYELFQTILSGGIPRVPLWSLALLCVAVGGPLITLVIWQDIRNIVIINPLHQNNLSFVVDVAEGSHKAPALLFQLGLCYWSRSSDLGPCYCLWTGR